MENLVWLRRIEPGRRDYVTDDGLWTAANDGRRWRLRSDLHHVDEVLPTLSAAKDRAEEFVILGQADDVDGEVDRAAAARSTLERLAKEVSDLRSQISFKQAIIRGHVLEARDAGLLSWTEIGLSLKVTKQAAQKQYSRSEATKP